MQKQPCVNNQFRIVKDDQTAQWCYSGYKIIMCTSSFSATECIKSMWNYVPTAESFADIGSRGCKGIDIKNTWTNGPSWQSGSEN